MKQTGYYILIYGSVELYTKLGDYLNSMRLISKDHRLLWRSFMWLRFSQNRNVESNSRRPIEPSLMTKYIRNLWMNSCFIDSFWRERTKIHRTTMQQDIFICISSWKCYFQRRPKMESSLLLCINSRKHFVMQASQVRRRWLPWKSPTCSCLPSWSPYWTGCHSHYSFLFHSVPCRFSLPSALQFQFL